MSNWVFDSLPNGSGGWPEDSPSRQEEAQTLSRRELLGIAGTGVAGSTLAGCSADGRGPQPLDDAWSLPLEVRPADAVFNPFASSNITGFSFRYEPFARFNQTDLTWSPVLTTDWQLGGKDLELTLTENREWTNGDQVTAEDISVFLELLALFDDPLIDFVSDWRVDDDLTIVLTLEDTETNSRLVQHRLLPRRLTVNRSAFGDLAERAATANSESERESVREDLRALDKDALPTNGPYSVAEVTTDRIRYEVNDTHSASEDKARPDVETIHLPSPSAQWDAIRNGDIDGHDNLQLAPGQRSDSPNHLESAVVDGMGGNALFLQYGDEWFGDLRVRRAIAYLLDGPSLAAEIGGVPVSENGMGPYVGINNRDLLNGWFADRSDYPSYGQDRERGEALLSEAGLRKVDGLWMTPDAEPFAAPIKVASSWGVGSVVAQGIARQLGEAGIAAEVVRLGIDRFQRQLESGEYRLAFTQFDHDIWHPYAVYDRAFNSDLARASWQFPDEIGIPMPVGGSEQTSVNPQNLTTRLQKTQDEENERDLVRTLGWMFNRTLPWIPSNKSVYSVLLTNDHWSYPDIPSDGEPPTSLKQLAPAVASNLAATGTLKQRFESN